MAKKIDGYIKLQIPAGQANPSPPVGPALGQKGVNIMEFCKAFNADTQSMEPGLPIPVVITVYSDKSFTYIKKTPPASVLLRKIAGIKSGSGRPNTEKVNSQYLLMQYFVKNEQKLAQELKKKENEVLFKKFYHLRWFQISPWSKDRESMHRIYK